MTLKKLLGFGVILLAVIVGAIYLTPTPSDPICNIPTITTPGIIPLECDGTYENLTLPCKCASLHIYVADTCPCFGADMYPDLYEELTITYKLVKNLADTKGTKPTGEYKAITLECACVLCVYVPGSSKCLEKKYPDLAKHLNNIYTLALKHQEKK